MKVHLLILAAGASTRMGKVKQLLPWKDTSLLGNAFREGLKSTAQKVSVVLGANSAEILKKEDLSEVNVIINPNWQDGMGTSIAFGLQELLKSSNPDALIITLADLPFAGSEYYNNMITKCPCDRKAIVASRYKEKLGVPALFTKAYFDSLLKLNGDRGAKAFLQQNKEQIISVDGSEISHDLDTMEEYLAQIKRQRSSRK